MRVTLTLCLVVILFNSSSRASAQEPSRPPNIIFILADDKDYYFCKKHVANEKTWKTPSIFKNWRLAKFG